MQSPDIDKNTRQAGHAEHNIVSRDKYSAEIQITQNSPQSLF